MWQWLSVGKFKCLSKWVILKYSNQNKKYSLHMPSVYKRWLCTASTSKCRKMEPFPVAKKGSILKFETLKMHLKISFVKYSPFIFISLYLNTVHTAIGFTIHTISFGFSKFSKSLNQYQVCLYFFECILHDDSKYSH